MVNKLKILRVTKGMSQQDLAKAIGVTQGAVCQWESRRCFPNAVALMRLSKLFGVSPEKIMEEDCENVH